MRFPMERRGLTHAGVVGATLLLSALAFIACYNDYGLTYDDYDAVVTLYDKNTDFGAFKTYFMFDSVYRVGDTTTKVSEDYDETILTTVASNFEARGYVRVTDTLTSPRPDFVVVTAKSASTTIYATGGWWGGYYPWYPWGPSWGYYPGYPVVSVGTYSQGSVFVDLIDPARTDSVNRLIGSVWLGSVNGLLGDVTSNTRQRIYNSINQMFNQSPYLGSDR